jgi:two-component system nitrate/nitrite response regulator NarL
MRLRRSDRAEPARVSARSRRQHRRKQRVTRIFIINAHSLYRDALRLLLEREAGFRVVGGAADCIAAARPVHRSKPDVLLLDLATGALPDQYALNRLATASAQARLVLLAPDLGTSGVTEALLLGAHGVVLKSAPREMLFRSIRAILSGQYWVGRGVVADLVHMLRALRAAAHDRGRGSLGLTARELEILSFLVGGCANKEIARRCDISERTVKHHLTNILQKVGVTNRLELVLFALRHQLVGSAHAERPASSDRVGSSAIQAIAR